MGYGDDEDGEDGEDGAGGDDEGHGDDEGGADDEGGDYEEHESVQYKHQYHKDNCIHNCCLDTDNHDDILHYLLNYCNCHH